MFPRSGLPLVVGDTNNSDRCKDNTEMEGFNVFASEKVPKRPKKLLQNHFFELSRDFLKGESNNLNLSVKD